MIEREVKVLLTEEEYFTLVMAMCKYATPLFQTNYYFDTDDLSMNQKGVTCRIRLKDGVYKATVKSHNTDNPDLSTEYDLSESRVFNPNIFNVLGLHCYGELDTQRYILYKNDYCEMVLDHNTYLGKTDFEIEIEYLEGCKDKAYACLDNIAELLLSYRCISNKDEFISRAQKGKSKSERFFQEPLIK